MRVLFTGSFDPITLGHIDIINRLCKSYSHVTIGVALNPDKKYMFTLTQRIAFITNAISDEYKSKVLVTPIDGLIANYVYENNIDHIARGVRDTNDLSSELSMAEYNRDLGGVETIFLPTKPELAKVSSSAVKVIAKNYGFVGDYVTTKVKHALEVKNGVNLIGVVGRSGSGKTTLCNALVNIMNNDITKMPYNLLKKQTNGPWRRAAFIDMDKLGHDIHKLDEPFAVKVRDALVGAFGSCVLDHHGHIDRSVLRNIVFSDKDALNILNSVMHKPMRHLFSRVVKQHMDESDVHMMTIFVDAAVLVENDSLSVVNNQVLHLITPDDICIDRIVARDGISRDQAVARLGSQLSDSEKSEVIERVFSQSRYGDMMELYGSVDDTLIKWVVESGFEYI